MPREESIVRVLSFRISKLNQKDQAATTEALDELVHDLCLKKASKINNMGVLSQLAYIHTHLGDAMTEQLKEVLPEACYE